MEPKDRIIVALDVSTRSALKNTAKDLAPYVGPFKIGLEAIMAIGAPQAIRIVERLGGKIFLDGKFCDIPNTVGGATKAISKNVAMFNVHASSGKKAIEAAAKEKGSALLLAVTVLTSLDEPECVSIFGDTPSRKVLQFARMAKDAGADGVICSPQELVCLHDHSELNGLLLVTPGVRPQWAAANDQKRVMTPGEAVYAGADMLVIGRPITAPPPEIGTPIEAAKRIANEIRLAFVSPLN